ncbi:MAG: SDR family oxidoreductase [Actinobacteria bacterium]|nr:SDR family oxidoreductase [Actinomycetota bacterium]
MESWALVTGATSGIGESFTRLLADNNYNVVLVARDVSRLQERASGLEAQYKVQTHIIQADLSTDAGCAAVEQYIASNRIEVLINNAGFGINKAFTMSELVAEQQLLDVLVGTPMRLMHVALPLMKERNKGVVINVSSVAGYIAGGTYSASKSYLTVLSESLHTELTGTHVKISALCPGFTRTEFHQRGRMSMKGLPNFMWLDSDTLVSKAWSDALKGKAVSIPGWQYKLLVFVIQGLPRTIVRKVGMSMRKKQRK